MKVSERIKELRDVLANSSIDPDSKSVMENRIIQLEVDIVEALQVERQEGQLAGLTIQSMAESLQIARQEGYQAGFAAGRDIGYDNGFIEGHIKGRTKGAT